jgi:hypothetical protein
MAIHRLVESGVSAGAARDRGVKFGRKPKLTRQQIYHARKLIDAGEP